MRSIAAFSWAIALTASPAHAQVKGTATGFATGVTGGGSAAAATPTSLAQLKEWLTDSTARTIVIDRTWDFTGTEGTTTGNCCSTRTSTCVGGTSAGQLTIADTCDDGTIVSCTYDNAARSPIDVGSNKSIVGKGSSGVLKGKGLRVRGGNSNVIIQNIHITNLNPQYVWGGDAITLDDSNLVWIDHNKFSLIGRQMIVSGWGQAGKVTISNNEFDGKTTWSSGCNGKHYWTMLLIGLNDQYTIANNWIHDVSGRAPHIGTTATQSQEFYHIVNNYFQDIGGHALDVDGNTWVLLEGNYFTQVTTPITSTSLTAGGNIYSVVTVAEAGACSSYVGYICEWNKAYSSGTYNDLGNTAVLTKASSYKNYLIGHVPVADVPSQVTANAETLLHGRDGDISVNADGLLYGRHPTTIPSKAPVMSSNNTAGFELQRKLLREPKNYIEGPGLESFTSRFGTAFPKPEFLSSDLGVTALYSLPAPSGAAQRRVLLL
ncbi:hypothetical protein EKO27_g11643, partial [Xylaria grammica]